MSSNLEMIKRQPFQPNLYNIQALRR